MLDFKSFDCKVVVFIRVGRKTTLQCSTRESYSCCRSRETLCSACWAWSFPLNYKRCNLLFFFLKNRWRNESASFFPFPLSPWLARSEALELLFLAFELFFFCVASSTLCMSTWSSLICAASRALSTSKFSLNHRAISILLLITNWSWFISWYAIPIATV